MKKILALGLSITLSFNLAISYPAFAILERNKQEKTSVLDYINFEHWRSMNDDYLTDYIARAVNNNYDIKTAALKMEEASINVTATRAGQFPVLSVIASPAVAKMPRTTKSEGSFALPVIASWEADIFGKNWDKTKSAKKLYKASEFQTQVSDIAIISLVAGTYYNIVKLDKIIQIQEKLISDRENIYNIMKLSNREGLVSTSDLILAEKSYVLAKNEMLEYQKLRQSALNSLAVLIGDNPNNTSEYKRTDADNLPNNIEIPNEISSDIIINRPDYKALEYQLQAAGIDVRVAKKEFLPSINILGLMTFLASSTFSSMNWKNSLDLAAASVDLPIFTGFARIANLKFNKNKYEQLLNQYQKTGLISIQEINDSLYNLKSDNEKFKNNIKALEIQEKDFKLSSSKFNKGVISKLDLLQQRESLLYMQKVTLQSKLDCYIDKISLYKTTGARI